MHLKYPHTSKFFTWEELSCLTSALGYPDGTLRNCIPEDNMIRKDGVSYREILKLIDLKFFNEALHLSVNMHTADYNINVIRQSMNLLNHRFLTFDELSAVRVAFQVYEAGDMRGMVIDKHTLMRTLKLCGRTIAPLKLMHRVKHMEERLDEPGRIQFYEFLDLIVLCLLTKEVQVPDPKVGAMEKTWRRLFELDDLERVFATEDEKLEQHLNKQFVGTERNYGREILGSKRIPRESSVDPSLRKAQVRYHSRRYRELKVSLTKSTGQVQNTKAGHVRARPVSAPGVEQFRPGGVPPATAETRPFTVAESPIFAHSPTSSRPISALSAAQKSDLESVRHIDPRLKLLQVIHDRKTLQSAPANLESAGLRFNPPPSMLPSSSSQHPGGPGRDKEGVRLAGGEGMKRPLKARAKLRRAEKRDVVTEEDVRDRQHILDSLQYEIETLEERTVQSLHAQLKALLPQHAFKSIVVKQREAEELENARLSKIEEERARQRRKREAKKAAVDSLDRLVHPNPRVFHTLHDRNCDSRSQGLAGTRRSGERRTRPTPKPLVLLDGQKLMSGSEQSIRLEKNVLDNMSSTGSVDDAASSVAQTTDIMHHTGVFSNPRHSRISNQTPYDPSQFRESRMGTAALLHSYFHDGEAAASDDVDEGIGTMPASTNRGESRDTALNETGKETIEKNEGDTVLPDQRKNSVNSDPRKSSIAPEEEKGRSRKPSRKFRSPIAPNLQFERTKLTRKIQIGEEDELWLHGYPLSEIDRLTFKSGDDRVGGSTPLTQNMSDIDKD